MGTNTMALIQTYQIQAIRILYRRPGVTVPKGLAPSCTIRPWTGLGRILEPCLGNHRKAPVSSVYPYLFPRGNFPRQTTQLQCWDPVFFKLDLFFLDFHPPRGLVLRRKRLQTHGSSLDARLYNTVLLRQAWEHRWQLKTVSHGAPLPTEHSKITILHGIGCSLNLSISYCCSFVFWEYLCGLLSMGKQSIGKLCHMSGHPLLQKARTFGLGPPAPPSNKHNRFQYTVPSHTKSCMAHSGGRGVRGKKPGFL